MLLHEFQQANAWALAVSASEWVATFGVSLLLLAYLLDITDKIADDSPSFFSLNMIGAGMASGAALMIPFWPFVVLEGVWCLVSAIALLKRLKNGPKVRFPSTRQLS